MVQLCYYSSHTRGSLIGAAWLGSLAGRLAALNAFALLKRSIDAVLGRLVRWTAALGCGPYVKPDGPTTLCALTHIRHCSVGGVLLLRGTYLVPGYAVVLFTVVLKLAGLALPWSDGRIGRRSIRCKTVNLGPQNGENQPE